MIPKLPSESASPFLNALENFRLSVVLPTFNVAPLMERHLKAMALWADLADEIVVVDSRSSDGTLDIIRSTLRHPNLRVIERDRGLYESWNEGIASTEGEWVYISTAGDTIDRSHLLHLLEVGKLSAADVVISPPRFVDETGRPIADLKWPPHDIINRHGAGAPFIPSPQTAACLAFLHCPSSILGSSASNLYRGQALRSHPFPCDFMGAGDTVWAMRHAYELRFCLTPRKGSSFCVHHKDRELPPKEAEAFLLRLIEEKAALARNLGTKYPEGRWEGLAEETFLYAKTRRLHQSRRAVWRAISHSPGNLFAWIGMTMAYAWHRARLGGRRRHILSQLLAENLGRTTHYEELA